MGHLGQTTEYFALSATQSVRINDGVDPDTGKPTFHYENVSVGGWLKHHEVYAYDADSRLRTLDETGRKGLWQNQGIETYDPTQQQTDLNQLSGLSSLRYLDAAGNSGYDAAGRLVTHIYHHIANGQGAGTTTDDFTVTYAHSYLGKDSWLESAVTADANLSTYRDGSTASVFDAWGRRTTLTQTTPLPDYQTTLTHKRYFANDAQGGILSRRDGTIVNGVFKQDGSSSPGANFNPAPEFITAAQWSAMTDAQRTSWNGLGMNQHFVYVNGQQVAAINEAGLLDVADRLTAYDSSDTGTSAVTVADGDTLQSVAQRVYGNSSLWYLLAQANAVSDNDLFTGQVLTVPKVQVSKNDAGTFKPYNPAETTGPTAPSTPYIQPPPPSSCNGLALIIMAVVAVVATVFTAGLAAPGVASGFSAIMGAGVGVLGGASGFAAALVAGAAGGFAGSIASQVVGKALGVVDHFSLRQAVAGGITGALTAGIATGMGGTLQTLAKAGNWAKVAGSAAMSSAAGYVGNRIAGVADTHFSWKEIAASTVSAVVASKISSRLGLKTDNLPTNLANGMIGGVVSLHVHRAFGFDDDVNYGNIAADAFGNAIGNGIVEKSIGGNFFGPKNGKPSEREHLQNARALRAQQPLAMSAGELAEFSADGMTDVDAATSSTPVGANSAGAGGMGATTQAAYSATASGFFLARQGVTARIEQLRAAGAPAPDAQDVADGYNDYLATYGSIGSNEASPYLGTVTVEGSLGLASMASDSFQVFSSLLIQSGKSGVPTNDDLLALFGGNTSIGSPHRDGNDILERAKLDAQYEARRLAASQGPQMGPVPASGGYVSAEAWQRMKYAEQDDFRNRAENFVGNILSLLPWAARYDNGTVNGQHVNVINGHRLSADEYNAAIVDAAGLASIAASWESPLGARSVAGARQTPNGFVAKTAETVTTPNGNFYTVAYQTKIDVNVWGLSDSVHFNRSMAALDDDLRADPAWAAEMEQLIRGIQSSVSKVGGRQRPEGWVWHHDREPGTMQLVPYNQHWEPSFWNTFHPDGRGGYAIWARPAGAPPRR